jgi:SAM-dependent methyltransferase
MQQRTAWKSALQRATRRSSVLKLALLTWHLLRGGERRDIALLRLRNPRNLFQPAATTRENRYLRLFAVLGERVADTPQTRILSFGCARGDEVVSLRRHFARAHITGIDINPANIRRCRARADIDGRMTFVEGSSLPPASEPFDLVLALSVFRHSDLGDSPASSAHLIKFDDFARLTGTLADGVRPGGYLVLSFANFRFEDTVAAAAFEAAEIIPVKVPHTVTPLYDRNNRLAEGSGNRIAIFRKGAIF